MNSESPILGVDGLWITETTTRPDLGQTLDLGTGGAASWAEADAFIRHRADLGLSFEVVADEDTSDLSDAAR